MLRSGRCAIAERQRPVSRCKCFCRRAFFRGVRATFLQIPHDEKQRSRVTTAVVTRLRCFSSCGIWNGYRAHSTKPSTTTKHLTAADRALALGDRTPTTRSTGLSRALEARALVSQRKGEYPKARADSERAVALLEADYPSGHPETADALTLLGAQLSREGDVPQSRTILARAAAMAEARYRPGHPAIAFALRYLANSYADAGNLAEGISLSRRALQIAEASLGTDHLSVALQLNDLAGALLLNGEYVAARTMFERALAIYTRREGATSVRTAAASTPWV